MTFISHLAWDTVLIMINELDYKYYSIIMGYNGILLSHIISHHIGIMGLHRDIVGPNVAIIMIIHHFRVGDVPIKTPFRGDCHPNVVICVKITNGITYITV